MISFSLGLVIGITEIILVICYSVTIDLQIQPMHQNHATRSHSAFVILINCAAYSGQANFNC